MRPLPSEIADPIAEAERAEDEFSAAIDSAAAVFMACIVSAAGTLILAIILPYIQ